MPQPTCRGPYAWLQYPYNLLIELASRFGAIGLLAIIIEGHPATLARFANLVKETLCGKRSEKPYDRPIQFPYQVSSRRVTREIASGTLREGWILSVYLFRSKFAKYLLLSLFANLFV